ncbi:hypothetical protein Q0N71_31250, partial [Bacillus thuringiensis]|uniref:hypothetical protein n=1 Tax=Bacillus thuringiensis TaxID=1428 RepID=UPI003458AE3E
VKVIVYEMLYLLEIPKLTFKTSSCAPLEFFLHFSGIAACTKQGLDGCTGFFKYPCDISK